MDIQELQQVTTDEEVQHWWIRTRFRYLASELTSFSNNNDELHVLEMGCGTAVNLRKIRELPQLASRISRIVGVEPALPSALEKQTWMKPNDIITATSENLQPAFNFLIAMDVLEHVNNDLGTLCEWTALLTPRSEIFITVPAFQWLWSQHDEFLGHKRRYTTHTLRELGISAGLKPLRIKYIFSYLVPLVFLIRKCSSRRSSKSRSDLKKTSYLINETLTTIGHLEYFLAKGNPFFGTSVVGVFEKTS